MTLHYVWFLALAIIIFYHLASIFQQKGHLPIIGVNLSCVLVYFTPAEVYSECLVGNTWTQELMNPMVYVLGFTDWNLTPLPHVKHREDD